MQSKGEGGLGEPATLYIEVKEIKSNYADSNSPLLKLGGVCAEVQAARRASQSFLLSGLFLPCFLS